MKLPDQWATYTDLREFKASEWTIGLKVMKELADHPFDGDILKFRDWRELMRDQLITVNHGYGRVLYELENEKFPLSFARIARRPFLNNLNVDRNWVTRHIWTSFRACHQVLPLDDEGVS